MIFFKFKYFNCLIIFIFEETKFSFIFMFCENQKNISFPIQIFFEFNISPNLMSDKNIKDNPKL